jgi:hypothetical protein
MACWCEYPGVNKSEMLDELVQSVEELLSRLPDGLDPEITALRDKVDDGIFDAWKCISSERAQADREHISGKPLRMGVAGLAILALSAGLLLGSRRMAARRFRVEKPSAAV